MSELAFLLGMAFLAGVGCGGALATFCSRPVARTDDPTHHDPATAIVAIISPEPRASGWHGWLEHGVWRSV